MAKTPRKTKSVSKTCEGLNNALCFISVAQKPDDDVPFKVHCRMSNNIAVATNGTLSAGIVIEEPIEAQPKTFNFLNALGKCGKEMSMTVEANHITLKSGSLTVKVVNFPEQLPTIEPDASCASIGEEIRAGFEIVAPFVTEAAKKVILSSVMLRSGSVVSTNGLSIMEYWHGNDNFPAMVLPKSFVGAIINSDKVIESIGFSDRSCTIFFADKSWIKSQLQAETYPDIDKILNIQSKQQPVPATFYEALKTIEPFSNSGNVYFEDGFLQSHRDKREGAVYEVPEIMKGPCYNIKELKRVESSIETIDFYSHNAAFYFGKNLRGALIGVSA